MTLRSMGLVAFVLALGCGRTPVQPPPAEVATVGSSPAPSHKPSPDDLLHARLQQAVRDLDRTLESHGPLVAGVDGDAEPKVPVLDQSGPTGISLGALTVSGQLPPEIIERIMRVQYVRFRACYDKGAASTPGLQGSIVVDFSIERNGSVSHVETSGDLPPTTQACVKRETARLSFPEPEQGSVSVNYPMVFHSSDASAVTTATPPALPALPSSPADEPPGSPPLAEGPWPIVVVRGTEVYWGDTRVASTETVLTASRIQMLDNLYEKAKQWREAWKKDHPESRFPGVAGIRFDPETPSIVVESVSLSVAFAGCPNLLVQSATEPAFIFDIHVDVPGRNMRPSGLVSSDSKLTLTLEVGTDEILLIWKRGATVESTAKATHENLERGICASWSEYGTHKAPNDVLADALFLRSGTNVPFETLASAARKALACTRKYRNAGVESQRPVFWLALSPR